MNTNETSVVAFPVANVKPVYLSCAETAKLVRAALKAAFPGVVFAVRSKTYAGGASINVSWTDGPTYDEGMRIAGQFNGATFDAMTDCKNYHTSLVDGRPVHHGADFIFGTRSFSSALLQRAVRYCNVKYGWTLNPEQANADKENYGLDGGNELAFATWNHSKSDLVWQVARKMRANGCIVNMK